MWSICKELKIPLDKTVENIQDLPYTISYVIRKRQQIDSFNELPKEQRPPEKIIWDGTSSEVEDWLDRVMKGKKQEDVTYLDVDFIEG